MGVGDINHWYRPDPDRADRVVPVLRALGAEKGLGPPWLRHGWDELPGPSPSYFVIKGPDHWVDLEMNPSSEDGAVWLSIRVALCNSSAAVEVVIGLCAVLLAEAGGSLRQDAFFLREPLITVLDPTAQAALRSRFAHAQETRMKPFYHGPALALSSDDFGRLDRTAAYYYHPIMGGLDAIRAATEECGASVTAAGFTLGSHPLCVGGQFSHSEPPGRWAPGSAPLSTDSEHPWARMFVQLVDMEQLPQEFRRLLEALLYRGGGQVADEGNADATWGWLETLWLDRVDDDAWSELCGRYRDRKARFDELYGDGWCPL